MVPTDLRSSLKAEEGADPLGDSAALSLPQAKWLAFVLEIHFCYVSFFWLGVLMFFISSLLVHKGALFILLCMQVDDLFLVICRVNQLN